MLTTDEPLPHFLPSFAALVDSKAWEHLGLTGDEFLQQWWAGHFRHDHRTEVAAMNLLMTNGYWTNRPDRHASVSGGGGGRRAATISRRPKLRLPMGAQRRR